MSFFQLNKGKLKDTKGSILFPQNAGLCLVLNVVNESNSLDYSFLDILDRKWKNIKADLKTWYSNKASHKLGNIRELSVQSDVWIIHMLCQDKNKVTDKKALSKCIDEVVKLAKYENASIHISSKFIDSVPEINDMIEKSFIDKGVSVYLYED